MLEIYGGILRTKEIENKQLNSEPLPAIPTDVPPEVPKYEEIPTFFGRRILKHSMEKSELTSEKILGILPSVLREHDKNADEIEYLYNYYKGRQPILRKTKNVRPEINNKVQENHAFEIVEFKKAYVYGEPVQYVQKGEKDGEKVNPEISTLNKFMESEDKSTRDKEIAEWQYICGTSYRWADIDKEIEDEDEAPFEIRTPDPRNTFVVYNSGIKGEQLFSGYISNFSESIQVENAEQAINKYRIITIYTEDKMYKFKEEYGSIGQTHKIEQQTFEIEAEDGTEKEVEEYPLAIKGHRIIEYPLNNARLGLIELVMSQLNALNQIKSDDLDGIDQFIQSLLVFINQEIDVEEFKKLIQAGAVEVTSSDPSKPADVKLLTSQLMHSETKVVTDDIYNNVLTICGIPRLNDKPSGGDTGQARLLGEGWTMADERAKQDELSFKKSERQFLKLVLKICKYKKVIGDLKISEIDIKFTRNKSDNLLVKTQGLMNMKEAQVPPETAFTICGLFSDPNDVYAKAKVYYGEDFWKSESLSDSSVQNIDTSGQKDGQKESQDIDKNILVDEGEQSTARNENKLGKKGVREKE